jgi:oxygen-dependent protoporphyrinogen oxidase
VLQVVALRGGSGAFCDAVAAALAAAGGAVRTGTAVRAVRPSADGVEVAGDGWSEAFDGCIVAVPAAAARSLVGEALPTAGEWLAGVRGRPAATLAIALDRPVGARYFGLSFARGESRNVAAACVEECKLPDRVPPGKGLLVVFPYPEVAARMMEMEADDALALLLPDLRRPFPGLEAAITGTRLYRFPHGWTVFYAGYLAHLGRFRAGAVEGDGRIALAGDYLRAPNVEGAVTSGLAAARRLLERLGEGRNHAAAAD